MWPNYCSNCGAPLPRADEAQREQGVGLVCAECSHSNDLSPTLRVAAVFVRQGEAGHEVLLVRRGVDSARCAGSYDLPGSQVARRDDARDAVVRSVWREAGMRVETAGVLDALGGTGDEHELTLWFRVTGDTSVEPQPGGEAEVAQFFSLGQLPVLPEGDRLVLRNLNEQLSKAASGAPAEGGVSPTSDVTIRLHRRKQRYRELLEAYTNELMRSAWINDLHLRLSTLHTPAEITLEASRQLATRAEVDEVRVWLPGPPDRCDRCPWAERCSQTACLHLEANIVEMVQEESMPPTDSSLSDSSSTRLAEEERIPFIKGVPAADCALSNQTVRAELPGTGATPHRFEGFPLDTGAGAEKGVLGLISRNPMDPNARRLFEVVARHVGTLLCNAQLVATLRSANEVKLGFISRMSHELKTPLTAILGYSELLREELLAADNALGADGAATIEESGRKLLGIVESILEIAKLQSGTVRFRKQPLDLVAVVRERLPRWIKEARAREVTIEVIASEGEAVPVFADRARLNQILDDLMDNAIKFSHDRGVISIELDTLDEHARCVIVDRGIGVTAADHERIWEPFQQVSEKIHLDYGGLGIGLALVKSLVTLQGGRVALESHLDEGSRFRFTLPSRDPEGER